MTTNLRIAFLPLTDVAVLAAAHERGFAEEEGLALDLVRSMGRCRRRICWRRWR
jgi:NitT/TauT family transport system ATP-binding protein